MDNRQGLQARGEAITARYRNGSSMIMAGQGQERGQSGATEAWAIVMTMTGVRKYTQKCANNTAKVHAKMHPKVNTKIPTKMYAKNGRGT